MIRKFLNAGFKPYGPSSFLLKIQSSLCVETSGSDRSKVPPCLRPARRGYAQAGLKLPHPSVCSVAIEGEVRMGTFGLFFKRDF